MYKLFNYQHTDNRHASEFMTEGCEIQIDTDRLRHNTGLKFKPPNQITFMIR